MFPTRPRQSVTCRPGAAPLLAMMMFLAALTQDAVADPARCGVTPVHGRDGSVLYRTGGAACAALLPREGRDDAHPSGAVDTRADSTPMGDATP